MDTDTAHKIALMALEMWSTGDLPRGEDELENLTQVDTTDEEPMFESVEEARTFIGRWEHVVEEVSMTLIDRIAEDLEDSMFEPNEDWDK